MTDPTFDSRPAPAWRRAAGHAWTIVPSLRHRFRPAHGPASMPWSTTVEDQGRKVPLSGYIRRPKGARRLLVVVHGLGGEPGAYYCIKAARAADAAGIACLRLACRGADRRGADLYHAGLTADLHAALASPELAQYDEVAVVGYSLGGHMTLRAATEDLDPRVVAVAAVCPPMDLQGAQRAIDSTRLLVYRQHLLHHLKEIFVEVSNRRDLPTSRKEALAIRTLRGWDDKVVARRFGFDGANDYYQRVCISRTIKNIDRRTLIFTSRADPMIPWSTVVPVLENAPANVTVVATDGGGHVGFGQRQTLGLGAASGVEPEIVRWLFGLPN